MASDSLSENHSPTMIIINSTLLTIFLLLISSTHSSTTLIEELNTLRPPPDFNTTLAKNCQHNPSLRYCNKFFSPSDLNEIFKFTIVASHLCNESKNPNCVESFPKIDLKNRPRIAPLYLSFDFFWKYCPLDIVSVDFSNNSLKGKFPSDVLLCTQIKFLDLSFNQFFDEIPVESFYSLTNLTRLNLSYNHFSEIKITDINFFARFNSSSFIRSGLFPSHHHYTIRAIILLACFPIFIIVMICLFGWLCFHRPDYLPEMFRKRYKFTVPILKAATNNFSKKNLLSKQDGVAIYKGILRDNTKVKIEIYRGNTVISREDQRNFKQECKVLVNLRHKNLVRVLGWCSNRRLRSIVAEWMNYAENIESWLSGLEPPPWKNRLKVMIGVVEGMRYLQEEWPEVGYDLSTSSILLSDNLEPLVSRFKVNNRNNYTKSKYIGETILSFYVPCYIIQFEIICVYKHELRPESFGNQISTSLAYFCWR